MKRSLPKLGFLFCALLCIGQDTIAQEIAPEKSIGVGFQMGGRQVPFFQRIKQFGMVPANEGNQIYLEGGLYSRRDSAFLTGQKKWSWGYGLEGRIMQGSKSYLFLPVAEVHAQWKKWELYVGRRKEIIGLIDTTQTIGAYSWSGNALPMPKIQFSTTDWVNFANGWMGFKAGLAHGWFGNQESNVTGHWLHQKWLYGRLGPRSRKWQLAAGLNHQAQWGGELIDENSFKALDGNLAPYPWYSYRFIVIPFLQKIVPMDVTKLPPYDRGLAIGNQLGSVDISAEYQIGKTKRLHIYKQHPYDFARSLYTLNNLEDGLYGLSYQDGSYKIMNRLLFEFFHSKSQGRTRFGEIRDSNFGEVDNYFGHGQYGSWSYRNVLLGTPFIAFLTNENGRNYLNNRTVAYHVSIGGVVKGYRWEGTFAWIDYWGNWGYLRRITQQSAQLRVHSPWYKKDIRWTASTAFDRGTNLDREAWGWTFSVQKRWN